MTNQQQSNVVAADTAFERELATLIVSSLNLDVDPNSIRPEDALYDEGLGLDSIDVLEVALVVSKQYGMQMKADNKDNFHIFSSLRNLAAYISNHRTK